VKQETAKQENELSAQLAVAITALKESDELKEFSRRRLDAEAMLREALKIANRKLEEIEKLSAQIAELPAAHIWRPIPIFISAIYGHAIDPLGYAAPPQLHELPHENALRVPDGGLSAACLELHVTRAELSAVAILRATREHPEIFKDGCASIQVHEAKIAAAETRYREAIEKAAKSWQWDSDTVCTGSGRVAFKLSDGAIDIGRGPGDTDSIERLLSHPRTRQNAETQEAA
jgi:hypothetical protein